MPFRSIASPVALRFQRAFHNSTVWRVDNRNHYETLQVPITAGPQEIKKSFYSLSKTHHPDRNLDDPDASAKFIKISEAYSVLGTPAKRQEYDRDVMRSAATPATTVPKGSYHSSGPAGGRPASGLSRRRTQFHGPPPSFYRSGGWGEHTAKRQAASEDEAHRARHQATGAASAGGMGPGQQPLGQEREIPHWDREGHARTHTNQERRRKRRVGPSGGYIPTEPPKGAFGDFLLVSGVLALAVIAPAVFLGFSSSSSKREDRKKFNM